MHLPVAETLVALSDASVPACMPAGPAHAAAAAVVAESTDIEAEDAAGHGEELRACHGPREDCREVDLACTRSRSGLGAPVSPAEDAGGVEVPGSFVVGHCSLTMAVTLLEVEEYAVDDGMEPHWSLVVMPKERVACVDSSIGFASAEEDHSCCVPALAGLPLEAYPYRHRHHHPNRLCH